jgi:hypothetical protein
LLLLQGG